jgi:hypothetical protein
MWQEAPSHEAFDRRHPHDKKEIKRIQNTAKTRILIWLAVQLGISPAECNIQGFDLETCRVAWKLLKNIDYPTIRLYVKLHGKEPEHAS